MRPSPCPDAPRTALGADAPPCLGAGPCELRLLSSAVDSKWIHPAACAASPPAPSLPSIACRKLSIASAVDAWTSSSARLRQGCSLGGGGCDALHDDRRALLNPANSWAASAAESASASRCPLKKRRRASRISRSSTLACAMGSSTLACGMGSSTLACTMLLSPHGRHSPPHACPEPPPPSAPIQRCSQPTPPCPPVGSHRAPPPLRQGSLASSPSSTLATQRESAASHPG
mmetsp:Transcript_26728/g.60439  ORF Transcript_26728/g.60439 Transcript_26728/m.60439 type:complete len:231 (+) Transcript_26728:553-1245(+)